MLDFLLSDNMSFKKHGHDQYYTVYSHKKIDINGTVEDVDIIFFRVDIKLEGDNMHLTILPDINGDLYRLDNPMH